MTDAERIEQIRAALKSSQDNPKTDNPAWLHTHNDCLFLLQQLDKMPTPPQPAATPDEIGGG